MFKSILSLITLLTGVISFAQLPTSKLTHIVRPDGGKNRVEYNFWSGEYPTPVIDLASKIGGYSLIKVEKKTTILGDTALCTVQNGIYHPWSRTKSSVSDYVSLVPLDEYKILRTVKFDLDTGKVISARKGDILTKIFYLAEGYCSGELILAPKLKRAQVDFGCDETENTKKFKKTAQSQDDEFSEQWIAVSCSEGFTGYIKDQDLLTSPGAREGRILGYGEVGPAE